MHLRSLISTFVKNVRCLDSIISLVSISEIPSLYLASVAVQAGLSLPWSKPQKTGFLVTRLILPFLIWVWWCEKDIYNGPTGKASFAWAFAVYTINEPGPLRAWSDARPPGIQTVAGLILRSSKFFPGDWSWNHFYSHSRPTADSSRAIVSYWQKDVH